MQIDDYQTFLAGFDLAAERREDGKLYPYMDKGEALDDWPQSISAFGNVYNLESVTKGENGYETGLYA